MLVAIDPQWQLSNNLVVRLPVILTLITSFIVLGTALGFHDIDVEEDEPPEAHQITGKSLLDPFRKIVVAGKWTVNHRFVLFVILAALAAI